MIGSCPKVIRHFIELRGIGVVDVKRLYGVGAVKDVHNIDLVIKMELWDDQKEYDRLGLSEEYIEFLGNKVVCNSIPVRPGRNLAIICETAAVNHRQKKMGYNAAEELNNRIMENIKRKEKEKNLRINSYLWRDNMYYIGVDLGGTKIAAGLVTEEGKLISKKVYPL